MKIVLIIGDQRRHKFFATQINRKFELSGIIYVKRGIDIPNIPDGLEDLDRKNFETHFTDRKNAEIKNFPEIDEINCPSIIVDFDKLNTDESASFIKTINPNLVFVFGSGLIKSPLIESLPNQTINLHLGLSPRYRGSATLFWPFYFLEPNFAGTTFHYLVDQPDAGDIIHQVVPKLEYGDKIHDVACKVVLESANAVIHLANIYKINGKWKSIAQKHSGKNFLDSDFHPSQLRLIYNTFDGKIVDYFLDNKLRTRIPKLIQQESI